jgi:hypothetical protein
LARGDKEVDLLMILPLVLWANIAQQEPATNIPPVSDKFVLVRRPGPTPARLKQAIQGERNLRIAELFPLTEYDHVLLEGTNFIVVIEKSAVPIGSLNDSLKLLTVIAKSPDLTAKGNEIPDSIAEMIFARSFVDFSKATPEVRNRLMVGAKLEYLVELSSPKKKHTFGYQPPTSKSIVDRVLQMTWPSLPQSMLRGEEPSDEELPKRPAVLDKEVTIDYTYARRPVDGNLMRLVSDAIQKRVQDIEKQIAEKTSEIESRIASMGISYAVLKSGGSKSELPQKVLEDIRDIASWPVFGNSIDENEANIFFASWERFSSTRRISIIVPLRKYPGNESMVMNINSLQ